MKRLEDTHTRSLTISLLHRSDRSLTAPSGGSLDGTLEERGQHKGSLMNLRRVVLQVSLNLNREGAHGGLAVLRARALGRQNEANSTRWIGRDAMDIASKRSDHIHLHNKRNGTTIPDPGIFS